MRHTLHHVVLVIVLCLCSVLLAVGIAVPAGAGSTAPPDGGALDVSVAPLNQAFLASLIGAPMGEKPGADVGNALGDIPGPQDFSYATGMHISSVRAFGPLPSTYDLRTFGRVTSVKNQNPRGTCWAFASCGSLESCLLPGETWDFSEDNMVLQSGFDSGGDPYDHGGNVNMSTAYLVRWGGPVTESQDGYNDGITPPGLSPSKHVQEVDWIPARGDALDNDNVKNAVMQYGGVYVAMGWYDSAYNSTTKSYYYSGSSSTNHGVLIVGWDDNYAATKFVTTPPGNGAFLVKNSWGTGWGDSGYFYVSYYDTKFGSAGVMAVFNGAESTGNYTGIYQYDPLGNVTNMGLSSSSTGWFANVFTAQGSASLGAVGFYTATPGASYEVYTGASLATKTLRSSGTLPYMGYHTVPLPSPVAVTQGQQFVVAVKLTTPGYSFPDPDRVPVLGLLQHATAAAGQSYVSSTGSSWTDLTTIYSNTNVCLKAYVRPAAAPAPTVTGFTPTSGPVGTSVFLTGHRFHGRHQRHLQRYAGDQLQRGFRDPDHGDRPCRRHHGPDRRHHPRRHRDERGELHRHGRRPQHASPSTSRPRAPPAGPRARPSPCTGRPTPTSPAPAQFSIWVVSPGNSWYVGKVKAADGTAAYSDSVPSTLPVGSGYSVYVYYRATSGDPWSLYGLAPGTVNVTAAALNTITVDQPPTGTTSRTQGQALAGALDDQRQRLRPRPSSASGW